MYFVPLYLTFALGVVQAIHRRRIQGRCLLSIFQLLAVLLQKGVDILDKSFNQICILIVVRRGVA